MAQQPNAKINLQDFSKGISKMLSNSQQKLPKYLEFLIKSKNNQIDDISTNENTKNNKPMLTEQYKQFISNVPQTFSFNSPTQKSNSNQHPNERPSLNNNHKEKGSNSELKHEKKIAHQSNKSSSNYHTIVNQPENKVISSKERKRKKKNSNAMSLDTADFQALKKYFQYQESSQKKDRNSATKKDSEGKKHQQRNKQEKYRIVDQKPNHKKKQSEDLFNCQKKSFQAEQSDGKQNNIQERKKQLTIHDFNNIVKKELSSKDQNLKTLNINLFEKNNCIIRKAIDLTQSTKSSQNPSKPQQFLSLTASSLKPPGKRPQQTYTFTKNSNLKLNNFVEMAREQSDLSIKTSTNKLQIKQVQQLSDTNGLTGFKKFTFIKESNNNKKKDNSMAKPKTNEQEKLQDRLTFLENKILSVKTNLESQTQQNSKKQLEGQFQSKSTIAASKQIVSFPQQQNSKLESIQNNDKNNNLINLFKKINSNLNKQSHPKMPAESKDLQSIKLQNEKLTQYLNKIKTQQETKKQKLQSKECPEPNTKSHETHHARNHTAQIELKGNNTKQDPPQISQLVTQVKLGSQQFSQFQANQPQTCSPPSPEQSQPNSGNYSEEFIFGFQELYYVGKLIESFLLDIDDYFVLMFRDHFLQSLQTLHFLQSMESKKDYVLKDKKVILGSKDPKKKTLILDLDETLIHCNESLDFPSDVVIPIQFPTGEKLQVGVNVRPYTRECLEELNNYFEIVIFTASHSCYANKVLDFLDPNKNLIKYRLFRENCLLTPDGFYVKDLDIFEDRDINEMVIVDNAVYSFAYHLANGIPILPFYDNPDDTELKDLSTYLIKLVSQDEIAKINSFVFRLNDYHKFMNPVQLLETLYPCFLEDEEEEDK